MRPSDGLNEYGPELKYRGESCCVPISSKDSFSEQQSFCDNIKHVLREQKWAVWVDTIENVILLLSLSSVMTSRFFHTTAIIAHTKLNSIAAVLWESEKGKNYHNRSSLVAIVWQPQSQACEKRRELPRQRPLALVRSLFACVHTQNSNVFVSRCVCVALCVNFIDRSSNFVRSYVWALQKRSYIIR